MVVIVVAFHGEEMARKGERGGTIKPRHFPINALIKSSRCSASGDLAKRDARLKLAWRWRGAATGTPAIPIAATFRRPIRNCVLTPAKLPTSRLSLQRRPFVFRAPDDSQLDSFQPPNDYWCNRPFNRRRVCARRSTANDCSREGNHRVC